MGADIKALKIRIKSVDSSLHLTKAMGLVASSKIRRANDEMKRSKQYFKSVNNMMEELRVNSECKSSPYLAQRDTGKTRLIVIAGDRGMAGGYNANVIRLYKEYPDAEIIPLGKRICDRTESEFISSETYSYAQAKELAVKLCDDFKKGEYDRLGIICTKYVSMMVQEAQILWVLPLSNEGGKTTKSMIFEPDAPTVLENAVPEYVTAFIIAAVRESFASEVAARRMAMDSAEKNAKQMIEDLELAYNSARQSMITQEITEIVAGSGKRRRR
ncbi:MAG: ATP synthase F1 subunit gamma [Clostridiales bacterium]|nr:ATP synthase F1 subunit gamma [Clostridiales bacterium]